MNDVVQVAGHQQILPCGPHGTSHLVKPVRMDAILIHALIQFTSTTTTNARHPTKMSRAIIEHVTAGLDSLCPFVPTVCGAFYCEAGRQQVIADTILSGVAGAATDEAVPPRKDWPLTDGGNTTTTAVNVLPLLNETLHDVCDQHTAQAEGKRDKEAVPPSDKKNQTLTFLHTFERLRELLKTMERDLQDGNEVCGKASPSSPAVPTTATAAYAPPPLQPVLFQWFIVMENACFGMRAPRVLDIKIGKMRTAPGAPKAEKKEAKDKGTSAKTCGLRITGMHYPCTIDAPTRSQTFAQSTPPETSRVFTRDNNKHQQHAHEHQQSLFQLHECLSAEWGRLLSSEAEVRTCVHRFLSDIHITAVCETITSKQEEDATVADAPKEAAITAAATAAAKSLFAPPIEVADQSCLPTFELNPRPLDVAAASHALCRLEAIVARSLHLDMVSILSTSVLIIYDALQTAASEKEQPKQEEQNNFSEIKNTNRSSLSLFLIDFDRCGPRQEHFPAEMIEFKESLLRLKQLLQ